MRIIKNVVFLEEPPRSLEDTTYESCSFKEYNFFKATISNCVFINCNFEGSNFSKAKINNCKFINCYMQFCAMTRVNILNSEFRNCDLWHSNLCHSEIKETLFEKTILRALFKELNWQNNTYDKETIVESCGGTRCCMNEEIILDLINLSKRTCEKIAI